MQSKAVALDEASIRDVRLFSGGLVQGQKLQDYVNEQVANRPAERLKKPFAAVATQLETGERAIFVRGNVGRAVRLQQHSRRVRTGEDRWPQLHRWRRGQPGAGRCRAPARRRLRDRRGHLQQGQARRRPTCWASSTSPSRSWASAWASRNWHAPTSSSARGAGHRRRRFQPAWHRDPGGRKGRNGRRSARRSSSCSVHAPRPPHRHPWPRRSARKPRAWAS